MSTPLDTLSYPNDPWVVYDYEVSMWRDLCDLLGLGPSLLMLSWCIRNAITESAVLHTRILIGILLPPDDKDRKDDIKLSSLLPSFASPTQRSLSQAYGDGNSPGTPCWEFNKMLAHATCHRTDTYNYGIALNNLFPLISKLLNEVHESRTKCS
jgi:hypothetical protein